MGIFDFVKDAGAKIGIGESKAEKAAEAKAANAAQASEISARIKARKAAGAKAERMERLAESKKALGLEKYVRDLGFDIEKLDVKFDDGVATISGTAADQTTREKAILAIGNTEGVGQVQDEIEVTDSGAESELHVVAPGDSLSAIAKTHYGDASKYPTIFEANRPMLSDPDSIFPGQVLRIPAL